MEVNKKIDRDAQDCWRRIGIWGAESARCEKLKFVKHCRNCEVFENAARDIMSERRKTSDGESLSIEEIIEKESLEGDRSVMPFRIGSYCFAVPSSAVLTVSDQVAIHSIPYNTNPVIRGLVAINHEVYTFISFTKLLNMPPRTLDRSQKKSQSLFKRALVVDMAGRTVVFYVEEVYQIQRYFEKSVELADKTFPAHDILYGQLKNSGAWCSDCQLLDLALTSKRLEVTVK